MNIYTYISESLWFTPETNTTLQINYTSIKKIPIYVLKLNGKSVINIKFSAEFSSGGKGVG